MSQSRFRFPSLRARHVISRSFSFSLKYWKPTVSALSWYLLDFGLILHKGLRIILLQTISSQGTLLLVLTIDTMVLSSAYIHPSPTSSDGHFRYKSFLSNSIQRSNSLASTGSLSSIAEEEEDCYDAYYYSDADESTSPPVVEFCRTSSPSLPPSSDLYVFHEDESRSSSDSSTRSHITPCTPLYAHRLSERLARFTVETLGFPSTPRNSKRFLLAPEYPQPKKRK